MYILYTFILFNLYKKKTDDCKATSCHSNNLPVLSLESGLVADLSLQLLVDVVS